MQAEWMEEQEPLPHWLEEVEAQATNSRLEAEHAQCLERLAELERLLQELPGLFERKFRQRLEPLLEREHLLREENDWLRARLLGPTLPPPLRLLRGGRGQSPQGEVSPPAGDGPRPIAAWEGPRRR